MKTKTYKIAEPREFINTIIGNIKLDGDYSKASITVTLIDDKLSKAICFYDGETNYLFELVSRQKDDED